MQIDGQIANFIEKKRPFSNGFEPTLLGVLRTGESALDVAEPLRFDQRWNERRAVDGSERLALAHTREVNRTRNEFLARPALSENQDGLRVLCNFLDQLVDGLHPRRHADQAAKSGPAAYLLAQ